jgi:phosphatidylethanolamine-binding protein (PEBP) family uncharacterized protein
MLSNTKVKRINNTKTNTILNNINTTKKINSKLESIKVSYPDTLLQSIKNTQDISQYPNIYKNAPQITILNAKPKLYLITMTDPDAPYGMTHSTLSNTKNHTYTHWVYLQDMRKKSNTNKSTNTTKILFTYAPPSPPYGIHRYQFKLYDVTHVSPITLDTIKKNISNTLDRNIDYISNKTLKPIAQFQYKVNSGKSPTITTTNPTATSTANSI